VSPLAHDVENQQRPYPAQGDPVDLQLELMRKERVIQEQKFALTAYRSAFALLWPVLKPLYFIARHFRAIVRPKLGLLHQHPPRDLKMPAPFVSRMVSAKLPSISIVTPSFNQAAFIGRTIESVLSQHYPKLEYLVQDGGSRDGTVDILRHNSDRVSSWESKKDNGQSSAINLGFAKTSGEVMGWLNSDDLLAPGCLAYVGEYFARHPDVDVVYGHRIVVDEKDNEIGRWILPRHNDAVLKWADFIPQETLFWRRSIWERAGGCIDESFRFAMDWDLLLRFRALGAKMVRLPRFLGVFRVHENQKTSALINGVGTQEMDRLRLRELGKIPSRHEVARSLVPYLLSHVVADISWRFINRIRRSC
jgi:glycosyltransferase involved in cell wall biosynthesis